MFARLQVANSVNVRAATEVRLAMPKRARPYLGCEVNRIDQMDEMGRLTQWFLHGADVSGTSRLPHVRTGRSRQELVDGFQ